MNPASSVSRASKAVLALFAVLALLDLLRPYTGDALRPWQWAIGAVTIVAVWRWLDARGQSLRQALPVLALAAFLLPTYVSHSRSLESDGIHYYTYLRSALFDHDLDLANDYALLGHPQRGPNVLPVGAAILWAPLVLVVHVVLEAARLVGGAKPTGAEPAYQAAVCFSTLAYGVAGLFLLQGALQRFAGPAVAFWTTLLCWWGTPLRFYLAVLPSLAHGTEFFAAVLALRAWRALRDDPTPRAAAWSGACCGLLFLVRSQDGLFLLLPGLELLRLAWRRLTQPDSLRRFGAVAGTFVLVALPQLLVWQVMFGVPLLIPHERLHGAGFMHLSEPQLLGTLIAPEGGLFASYPILLLAAVGLLFLFWREPRYVLTVTPVLLLTWYVNSTVFDWYQVRRFTGVVPLLAPGLAMLLAPLARAGWPTMALLAFLTLRYDHAVDDLRGEPGQPVPVRAAVSRVADDVVRDGYRLLEPHAPVTAVKLLASYTGERILSEGVTRLDLASDPAILHFPEESRGLSSVTAEDGVAARWVNKQECRLFVPLSDPTGVVVTVHARALETPEPQSMTLSWNDQEVAEQPVPPSWSDIRFHVPASFVHPGTNVLVLHFALTPVYRQVRNEGPREVRPAAVAWMTLHRESESQR